jgi:hypothetical protein
MLRLHIRCRPRKAMTADQQAEPANDRTVQMTGTIASTIMESMLSYLRARAQVRPWTSYTSTLLVDVVSYVAPWVKEHSKQTKTSGNVLRCISEARQCLETLATSKVIAAHNSVDRLTMILAEALPGHTDSIPRPIPQSTALCRTRYNLDGSRLFQQPKSGEQSTGLDFPRAQVGAKGF